MAIQESAIGSPEHPIVWKIEDTETLIGLIKKNPDVRYLNIFTETLPSLPAEIGSLQRLHSLKIRVFSSLGYGELRSLPDSTGDLVNLRKLEVSNQKLAELPKTIGKLQKLSTLRLYGNRLETLPEELGDAQNLTELDVRRNLLKSLPRSLVKLNLTMLIVTENPGRIENLADLCSRSIREILAV